MIILSTDNPKNSIYYLGSILLDLMKKNAKSDFGVFDYFEMMNMIQKISMNRFLLVLDWLFMLGKVTTDSEKGLHLCI